MDEIEEKVEEKPTENLEEQLNTAKEEIQSLTQQLNCLLVLTKKYNNIIFYVLFMYKYIFFLVLGKVMKQLLFI